MTATQLALGIFFGLTSVEIFKVLVASAYESHKRSAAKRDITEIMEAADGFVDRMHKDLMAERAAEEAKKAKRRKPAVKKAPAKKPVAKKTPAKKTVTTKKGK